MLAKLGYAAKTAQDVLTRLLLVELHGLELAKLGSVYGVAERCARKLGAHVDEGR